MSVALFIVLEKKVDFDTITNGKFIANEMYELIDFCIKHKIESIERFISQDLTEFEEVEIPEYEVEWFDAEEGLKWIEKVESAIKTEKSDLNVDLIIDDLAEYKNVLLKAKQAGVKWHIEMDI